MLDSSFVRQDRYGEPAATHSGNVGQTDVKPTSASRRDVARTTDDDCADAQVVTHIAEQTLRAAHLLKGVLGERFADFDLTEVRYAVLKFIATSDGAGCSQRSLARELCQSESSISTLVDRMRNDGLLFRSHAVGDRRRRLLNLSDGGQDLLRAVDGCRSERIGRMLQGMGRDQARQLAELMGVLVDELAAAAAVQKVA